MAAMTITASIAAFARRKRDGMVRPLVRHRCDAPPPRNERTMREDSINVIVPKIGEGTQIEK